MIALFQETWHSLTVPSFGQKLLPKTVGDALWYWTRYLLIAFGVVFLVALGFGAVMAPKAPGFLEQKLPSIDLTVQDGKASSSVVQPYHLGDKKFSFILDTHGTDDELNAYDSGILVLEDRFIVKKSSAEMRTYPLKGVKNFSVNRAMVVSFVRDRLWSFYAICAGVGLFFLIFLGLIVWTYEVVGSVLYAAVTWIFGLILQRGMRYEDALKMALYATVIQYIALIILKVLPVSDGLTSLLLRVIPFAYMGIWVVFMPKKKKSR